MKNILYIIIPVLSSCCSKPKTEKYVYDQSRNLKLMEDIWNGRKVSELEMRYDEKCFLISFQRKSDAAKAHYFEDRTLQATYSFY